jgi:NAD(P)-dependent dehydrogenase (short-subunit alcohol dehydrogenase family)
MARTIVITGCSSGFGRATALHLAQHGWHVFATLRNEVDSARLLVQATQLACADYLTPVLCDITSSAQVAALSRTVAQATPRLDALLNNAGTAFPAPLELLALDDLRAQLEINVIGHVAVTQALLPLLKVARGIIINVTSICGRIVFPVIGAYVASKFALEAVSDVLRIELAPFGVRVVVIRPHTVATAIWETSRRRTTALMQAHEGCNPYMPLMVSVERFLKQVAAQRFPPEIFADKVRKILNVARPRASYAIPRQMGLLLFLHGLLPNRIWDWQVRRTLRW